VAHNITVGERRVVAPERLDQFPKLRILNFSVGLVVGTLKLNTDGEVVAIVAATPMRLTGMPRSVACRYKL
jgi:hypothetical protein